MDWERIEQDVHFQTQQALVSASSVKDDVNKTFINSHFYDPVTRDEQLVDYRSRHNKKALQASLIDKSSLEGYVNDLRNVTVIQSKKVLSIENILSTYSEVFESSSAAQTSLEMRIQDIEQNIRGNNKFASDASKERSALSITVKSISGKVATIEDSLQNNEHCYATKEAFAQLLDSTVDEIKSVGAVVSQANVKSAQSVTLIEALIQAIHRMRGQTDNFSVDDTDRSLSFEFLSSLTGYVLLFPIYNRGRVKQVFDRVLSITS